MSAAYRAYLATIKGGDMITARNDIGDKVVRTVVRVTKTMIVCRDRVRFNVSTGDAVPKYFMGVGSLSYRIVLPEDKP